MHADQLEQALKDTVDRGAAKCARRCPSWLIPSDHYQLADLDGPREEVVGLVRHAKRTLPISRCLVRFDEVLFLEESSGAPAVDLGTWSTWEQMGPLKERAAAAHPLDTFAKNPGADPTVYDYFHLNSIAFSGPRSMIVCLRNVDLVVEVDLPSGALGRSFGPGTLDWPHAPTPNRFAVCNTNPK